MSEFIPCTNLTACVAEVVDFAPQQATDGNESLINSAQLCVIARGTFDIPAASAAQAVRVCEKPSPMVIADLIGGDGDMALNAVRYESDFVPIKARADCLCVGSAHPPGGASTGCVVSFGVGSHFEKRILVVGDRTWTSRIGGLRIGATEPAMFRSMPVTWENAYGGKDLAVQDATAFCDHNPVGKGYVLSPKKVDGLPLPNLEDPARPLRGWKDRVLPRGFGPVGRTWQPRLSRAGTYDQRWIDSRAPRLPLDFDERYYNCAPDDQQVEGYLRGDEEVRLSNLHPKYATIIFRLPGIRLRCLIARARPALGLLSLRDATMNLDTLWVDAEALQLVLVWRARLPGTSADERLILVEEPLDAFPPALETYRPLIAKMDAAEAQTMRVDSIADSWDEMNAETTDG